MTRMMPGRNVSTTVVATFLMVCCYCSCCTTTNISHAFLVEPLASSATIITRRRRRPPPRSCQIGRKHSCQVGSSTTTLTALTAFRPSLLGLATKPMNRLKTTTASSTNIFVSTATTFCSASLDWSIFCPPSVRIAFSLFYLLIILFPNENFTKRVLGNFHLAAWLTLVHFVVFFLCLSVLSEMDQGATLLRNALQNNHNMAASSSDATTRTLADVALAVHRLSHPVLTWDFFVAWWIWRDGIRRKIFTSHSILLCWLLGPSGLLLHWLTCLWTGNSIVAEDDQVTTNDDDD